MRKLTTEDGYCFIQQPDGSWTDGDMTFENLQALTDSVGIKTYQTGEGQATADINNADFAKEVYEFIYFDESEDARGRLQVIAANEFDAWQAFNEVGMLIYPGAWIMKFLGVQPCKR